MLDCLSFMKNLPLLIIIYKQLLAISCTSRFSSAMTVTVCSLQFSYHQVGAIGVILLDEDSHKNLWFFCPHLATYYHTRR